MGSHKRCSTRQRCCFIHKPKAIIRLWIECAKGGDIHYVAEEKEWGKGQRQRDIYFNRRHAC